MNEIIGKIEGKQAAAVGLSEVSEQNSDHFIVTSGERALEIFLSSSGLLSDGNALDGIEVLLDSEKERIIRERFSKYQTAGVAGGTTKGMILKASMPGMVKAISVSVGDLVQKETQVLVLEAMKMENSITAGFTGVVSNIYIAAGTSVEKNMPLIEFQAGER
jgi:biotin carboxyl carrier protein